MGKHKHKSKSSKKKKHRSSSSDERDVIDIEKKTHKHKKHHKEKKKPKRKSESLEPSDDEFAPPPAKVIKVRSSSSRSSFSLSPEIIADDNIDSLLDDDFINDRGKTNKKNAVDVDAIRKKLGSKKKTVDEDPLMSRLEDYHHRSTKLLSPPPTSRLSSGSPPHASTSDQSSLSIEETNKIRLKLGLKPLEVPSSSKSIKSSKHSDEPEKIYAPDTGEEFIHKPAKNMTDTKQTEKIAAKLKERKEKREIEARLLNVKKLADSDSDDDVKKWISKSRKLQTEKELAEKKAKELDDMDEVFGIGDLIDEEIKTEKSKVYSSKHIKGLKVEHDINDFSEGRNVILTLKDQDVLADDVGDTLVNVNMMDDERYKKNVINRKQKSGKFGYSALDDEEFDENGDLRDKNLLSKYDEEIDGAKKKSFAIGENFEERRRSEVREKLYGHRKFENLSTSSMKLASDYLTEDEVAIKFKKPKKKVRKIRKTKLKADDLLNSGPDQFVDVKDVKSRVKPEPDSPYQKTTSEFAVKDEPEDDSQMELDVDDLDAPTEDLSEIKMLEMDDGELQIALNKARKLKQMEGLTENTLEKVAKTILEDQDDKNEAGGAIILNSTAEFCRTLGDIPTYGQAGNRGEEEQELLDFEREMEEERLRGGENHLGDWNEVDMDTTPSVSAPVETPILDAEPDLGRGIAGALNLALSKGYLEKEVVKRPSASRFAHLQAQNYSIDDKAHQEDDKFGRRERYSGPTSDFKEKEGYKPNIKLDYIDDDGHLLSSKEAFRYLSHKFHGKGPSKNKIEKRMRKVEQEALMKQMSSTDTPLGTLNMLQSKQKETQSPFIVLSGNKQLQATSISKLKR